MRLFFIFTIQTTLKMCKKILFLLLLSTTALAQQTLPLIPKPSVIQQNDGYFKITAQTIIQADPNAFEAQYLQQCLQQKTGLQLQIMPVSTASSKISLSGLAGYTQSQNEDAYSLLITPNVVAIRSNNAKGLFYGTQTLLQLLPEQQSSSVSIPCLAVDDTPKFAWRGMHLDVARHFFPVSFVKKYIDYLATYKFNTFHWHLTDDQGWRIEIKKYPKLTETGAWRNGSMIGHYNDQTFDSVRYGGYYTQEEIKEVVAYAQKRHITIVPEIEMPGHARAALAAYPQYSCTGGPFEVAKEWGVLEDVFCPTEETFTFLEGILDEVVALFPSSYIHIGGDECPKTRWKACPKCQQRMKDNHLKDEHELQSYFIQRIEKYLNHKGKKIIGWDEILEGGLAPNAAVMSWRGTEGGIAAARQKHYVVMSPGSHCYFDHYQGEPKNEPLAIGGYTTLEKVYGFNPIPSELSDEEGKYILGAQANVWTEYIATPEHVEYMIFPRILALSEVLWGTANPADYSNFFKRVQMQFTALERQKINYSKAVYQVTTDIMPRPGGNGVLFLLKSDMNPNGIRYTTDGNSPAAISKSYTNPLEIKNSQTVKAAYFDLNVQKSSAIEQEFIIHKGVSCLVTLEKQPHRNYAKGGSFALVNGVKGDPKRFGRDWLGFAGDDLNALVDLGKKQKINRISLGTLENNAAWIYFPKKVVFSVSADGITFIPIKTFTATDIQHTNGELTVDCNQNNIQFVKITAENYGKIPDGKAGAGNDAWLFADEIVID